MARNRKTLFLQIVIDIVINLSAVSGALLVAYKFDGLGTWSMTEMFFLGAYSLLVTSLVGCLFGQNMASVSRRLARGQLDHALLAPRRLVWQLLYEGFNPLGQPVVLPAAIGTFVWTSAQAVDHLPWWWPVASILSLASSVATVFGFQLAVGMAAMWDPYAGEELSPSANRITLGLSPYPLDGLDEVRRLLLHAIPVAAVAWMPSSALLEPDASLLSLAGAPITAIAVCLIALAIFRKGVRRHVRGFNSRYSASGFRR